MREKGKQMETHRWSQHVQLALERNICREALWTGLAKNGKPPVWPFLSRTFSSKKPAGLMLEDDLTIMPTMNAGSFNYRATQWIILLSSDNLLHTQLIWHSQTAQDGPVIFIKRINNDSCLRRKAILMAADQMSAHYGKSDRSVSAARLTVRGIEKKKSAVFLPCWCHCRKLAKLRSS